MNNPLPVGERAYRAIKQRLFDGELAPGRRLDIVRLGDLSLVSTTPVREALHRLVAERLVENRTGEGFFVPRPSFSDLRRLYRWHGRLAAEAISCDRRIPPVPAVSTYAERASALFDAIAHASADAEVRHALLNADERLRGLRRSEADVVPTAAALLAAVEAGLGMGDRTRVRRDLARRARLLGSAAADILDHADRMHL